MKTARVELDPITLEVSQAFDYTFDGTCCFSPCPKPSVGDFSIGVIVGGSGTGKSILLSEFGTPLKPLWEHGRSVASHFASAEDAMLRLSAAGLNSIPDWVKPYQVLSTGQQFRADLARSLVDGACVDEFTSTVDRDVAKSASVAVARYARRQQLRGLVFATCHRDIVEWLEPDWVFDTEIGRLDERRLRRPGIEVVLVEGGRDLWPRFAPHHYLSADLACAAHAYTLWWKNRPVGFCAVMPMPGAIKGAWRGHRTVILPEFQGLGLGGRMVEMVGDQLLAQGKRFFCRTAHPWVGRHRDASPRWRVSTTSGKRRILWKNRPSEKRAYWRADDQRVCWSHEYLGEGGAIHPLPATAGPYRRPPPAELRGGPEQAILQASAEGEDIKALAERFSTTPRVIYRVLRYHGQGRRETKRRNPQSCD